MKNSILLTLTFLFLFAQCSKEKPLEPSLNISQTAISASAIESTINIQVTANGQWSVYAADKWIHLGTSSGMEGQSTLSVTLEANPNYDPRESQLTFRMGELSKTTTITQAQKEGFILTSSDGSITKTGGSFSVSIQSNVGVRVSIPATVSSWISQTKALTESSYEFIIEPNYTGSPRTAEILFTSGSISEPFVLTQYADLTQRDVLAAFFTSLNGADWTTKTNWGSDKPLDQWYGIGVNDDGDVVSLNLTNNNLSGSIPGLLSELSQLNTLMLNSNKLSGRLPVQLSRCENLASFDCSTNNLDLSLIPEEIKNHKYYGFWNITPQRTDVNTAETDRQALVALYMACGGASWTNKTNWNSTEPLKSWYGVTVNSAGRVTGLNLQNNNLSGSIPEDITKLSMLSNLRLNTNKITGSIPESIGDMHELATLYLYENQLTGSIPASIGNLTKMTDLSLRDNQLSGSLPEEMGRLVRLVKFWAYNNQLSGQLPTSIGNCKLLQILYLYNNQLDGMIPVEIGNFTDATAISLHTNNLTGTIPEELGYLEKLSYLYLHHNRLTGMIPESLLNHPKWDTFYDLVFQQQEGYGFETNVYESSDYSADGKVRQLHKATKGRGVNIVIMGDAFADIDHASGKYDDMMNRAGEHFLSVEPTKSYQEYFNIYAVSVVSKNNTFTSSSETALSVMFNGGSNMSGDIDACTRYAELCPNIQIDSSVVLIVANSTKHGGTCHSYSTGAAFAFFTPKTTETAYRGVLLHESVGHGLGKLLDEYLTQEGYITQEYIDKFNRSRTVFNMGWNLSLTKDPGSVPWSHFIGRPGYNMVGVFEGGYFFPKGVFRAEYIHCMHDNRAYFNGPSRELIVKRIMLLAGEPYSFEDFLAKDKYDPIVGSTKSFEAESELGAPPVLIEGSPKD